jgi:hypothetical protein
MPLAAKGQPALVTVTATAGTLQQSTAFTLNWN